MPVTTTEALDLQVTIDESAPEFDARIGSADCTNTCATQPNCYVNES
ncbi:MAG: hypothetical protein ACRD0P_18840 [Stackebrandtia sp.]